MWAITLISLNAIDLKLKTAGKYRRNLITLKGNSRYIMSWSLFCLEIRMSLNIKKWSELCSHLIYLVSAYNPYMPKISDDVNLWICAKNSMKRLKQPTSVLKASYVRSAVLKTPKTRKIRETKTWITNFPWYDHVTEHVLSFQNMVDTWWFRWLKP